MKNNSQGWVKIHRQILEWEWYDEPNTFRLFFHLLLKANHKEKSYRGVIIKVGQVMTGLSLLATETKLSVQKIRTSLNKLKSTNEITINSTAQGTIIQLVNYKKYQLATNEITNEQQTNNKQVTTNKNVNNDKKEKFEIFWALYPKKVNRKQSLEKWIKLTDEEIKLIGKTINAFIAHKPFADYTHPNPTTYLNQKRWQDEMPKGKYEGMTLGQKLITQ
jgi:hypothetical protein